MFINIYAFFLGFPGVTQCKEYACQCKRHGFSPWVRKIPWRRKWQPTPVFLPGEFHGQRSLSGYSSRDCKELDMIFIYISTCVCLIIITFIPHYDLLKKKTACLDIRHQHILNFHRLCFSHWRFQPPTPHPFSHTLGQLCHFLGVKIPSSLRLYSNLLF